MDLNNANSNSPGPVAEKPGTGLGDALTPSAEDTWTENVDANEGAYPRHQTKHPKFGKLGGRGNDVD